MNFSKSMLRQRIVYWPKIGLDSYSQAILGPGVELKAYYEEGKNRTSQEGGTLTLTEVDVYLADPVEAGGYIWLGKKEDAPAEFGSDLIPGSREIQGVIRLKAMKGSSRLYEVILR